jgi:hypothetical protein
MVGEYLASHADHRRQFYTLQNGPQMRSAYDCNEGSLCLCQTRAQVLQLLASLISLALPDYPYRIRVFYERLQRYLQST